MAFVGMNSRAFSVRECAAQALSLEGLVAQWSELAAGFVWYDRNLIEDGCWRWAGGGGGGQGERR